ncbi:MAG: hypothetical protein N0C88_01415 [Candidatus Thiodiazotropha lotti]|uniref:Uncharacterized protein n=1 Tax=Candidatus Thiodiazotropha lotti TaxID=2792787 RepID=A0A9E4MZI0_9GAMM|nr:hypothetical protein [Candidatus Thiodiazotropha lotti]MCW4201970.1 hypothetical protein [Candidatus Thiodiazotropha lotti]
MNTDIVIVLGFTLYKIASLAVGGLFAWLGYKLFMTGIWGNAGDLDTKFKDSKLVLKNAAPGTFFAVLGAVIILATLIQGMDFYWSYGESLLSNKPSEISDQPELP